VVVVVMDRPRHEGLVKEIRATGAALRMVGDGDIAAAIAPSIPESGIDLFAGVGGSPEAVLASAALKCLGGDMLSQMAPRDDAERAQLVADGWEPELGKIFFSDDLASGPNIIFCATGISDSPMLRGIRTSRNRAVTYSILMRAKTHSLRYIETHHELSTKKIPLRSTNR
jgi:fructose-1,6-bisphosphatase II